MKKIVDFYSEREVIYIDSDKFSDLSTLPEYQFRNLVVIGENGKGRRGNLDLGAFCYSKRTNFIKKVSSCKVVESTLDKTLESVFDIFIKSKLSKCARTSVHYYRSQLKNFADYYFSNLPIIDFNDYKACCLAYEQYTQMLLFKKVQLLSSIKKTDFSTLANTQLIFAELICLYHNKNLKKFKETYVVISQPKVASKLETVSLTELSYFYDFNKKLFHSLTDFLINEKNFPFIFSYQKDNPIIVHYPFDGFAQTLKKKLIKEDGFLVNRSELQEVINAIDEPFGMTSVEGHKLYLESIYNGFVEGLNKNNYVKSLDRARLINYAVSAFAMCFYCESSINPSQLYSVKPEDLNDFRAETKGLRISVIKPRAGYKQTELLISAQMLPLIEDYKIFRLWALSHIDDENTPYLLFHLNTKLGRNDYFKSVNNFTANPVSNYKRWILNFLPSFNFLKPNVIRKSISTIFFNESKSAFVTSKKLGNTPVVVGRHYIEASEEEFTGQVSDFFDAIHEKISNKYRKNNEVINVTINVYSEETAMGGCKELIPRLHHGFTNELEKPNCSNPSSCLFCENYVVHSDREDIRKLMSLKKILSICAKNDEAHVVIRRINEILKILYEKYPETQNNFITVAESVELGEFDEYWQDHLDLLLGLGVEFYG